MKKTIKGFLLGVIITTILMSTVFGSQLKESIDVIFNSVNITLNGEKADIDNILYEGTTYVPIRSISEMFNRQVAWEASTKTASIYEKETEGSLKFTEEEIEKAIKLVESEFDFPAATLTKVWYDEEKSNKEVESYLKYGKGSINEAKPENVIVLLSNFDVDESGDNPVLNPGSTYTDYNWILIRDSKSSDWKIDDRGY